MISYGPEYRQSELPCIEYLRDDLGYDYLPEGENEAARDGLNQVILRDVFIEAVQRLNDVPEQVVRSVYQKALGWTSNSKWTKKLRGEHSEPVPGEKDHKTIHLIDFLHPERNTFTVTRQLYVKAEKSHIPDLVVFVNGIPLVVIECKRPKTVTPKAREAYQQIREYEDDIPRLFYSNLFNIITDGIWVRYGATGASSEYWSAWKDPWPKTQKDFPDEFERSLWALLEPSRLLDLLAHFVVFEKRDEGVIKKICRYQQFRAVNKIVQRVTDSKHRRGLIWHTQGSGKSLTMAFATLKLKTHRTIESEALINPNIMVLTDRVDLDDQITKTFEACGLRNPTPMGSVKELQETIRQGTPGLTVLSTIFKFHKSKAPLPDSDNWIVLVDECHRTQEKDLGAYLQATLPNARFFGFTGTPVKTTDKDTYRNFGAPGEGYLDKYSIDDAVADGATVPIRYTARKTQWHLEGEKLDVLFDQWFADLEEEALEKLKAKGASFATLCKHPKRVQLIAYDIWNHYQTHVRPDGYKAQIVGIDREAVILYKRALDRVIAEDLVNSEGLAPDEARERASAMSACVYSGSQTDGHKADDEYTQEVRADLKRYLAEGQQERDLVESFKKTIPDPTDEDYEKEKDKPQLLFLIVCNKLLTGFDAPIEQVMYLDNPLKEHNLLQAIARTNRVAGQQKQYGLIVDYIGITKKLDEALESYRSEDVQNAMLDLEALKADLKSAHADVMEMVQGIDRTGSNVKAQYNALIQALGTEDMWFTFRRKAKLFIRAYEALAPDPFVLDYTQDLKWIANSFAQLTQAFEKTEGPDLGDYSGKIRAMLAEHLDVTGLRTVCKLRSITDPDYWQDFETKEKSEDDLKTAAIRKSTELKKILREKTAENPLRYGPFSERIKEIIERFDQGLDSLAETLEKQKKLSEDLRAEDQAHESSSLNERAFGIYKILESFQDRAATPQNSGGSSAVPGEGGSDASTLESLATNIDGLYSSDQHAPVNWHLKKQLQKELRSEVRSMANRSGFKGKDLRDIPNRVHEYALKTYRKIS